MQIYIPDVSVVKEIINEMGTGKEAVPGYATLIPSFS